MPYGVKSWSVDTASELAKLDYAPRDAEIAVRFTLSVPGRHMILISETNLVRARMRLWTCCALWPRWGSRRLYGFTRACNAPILALGSVTLIRRPQFHNAPASQFTV